MPYKTITPDEAKKLLDSEAGYLYIDVRSTPEFQEEHALDAHQVPLADIDPGSGAMIPNVEFENVMEKLFPKDAKLILACAAGGRSQAACEMLTNKGYTNLHNMYGGFLGAKDPYGTVLQEGWKGMGYPSANGGEGGVPYEEILKRMRQS